VNNTVHAGQQSLKALATVLERNKNKFKKKIKYKYTTHIQLTGNELHCGA